MISVESSVRRGQILSFSLVWLAYFVTYLLRKPLGVVKTDIATDLGLSKVVFSTLIGRAQTIFCSHW